MNTTISITAGNTSSDTHTLEGVLILLHNQTSRGNLDVTSSTELTVTQVDNVQFSSEVDTSLDSSVTPHTDKEANGSILWNIFQSGEVDLGIIAAALGLLLVCIAGILLFSYLWKRRKRYTKLFSSSSADDVGFIYNPVTNNPSLDEEYENTFVGVSIPLLQDVSKV